MERDRSVEENDSWEERSISRDLGEAAALAAILFARCLSEIWGVGVYTYRHTYICTYRE